MGGARKLGIALGGGGARGMAHIGFFQVLDEAGIEVSVVTGTSMGAIVGAGYAIHKSGRVLQDFFERFLESEVFNLAKFGFIKGANTKLPEKSGLTERLGGIFKRALFHGMMLTRPGLLSDDLYKQIIDFFIPEIDFSQTKLPFACAALDLASGQNVVFDSGSLRLAVRASAAIPGMTEPVYHENHIYCDGGATMNVPVEPLIKMGANPIIAIDVDRDVETLDSFGNVIEVIIRLADSASGRLKEKELAHADLVIAPEVGEIHWADYEAGVSFIECGRNAARDNLSAIKDLAGRKWWKIGLGGSTRKSSR